MCEAGLATMAASGEIISDMLGAYTVIWTGFRLEKRVMTVLYVPVHNMH
jgi:hypothetical protein